MLTPYVSQDQFSPEGKTAIELVDYTLSQLLHNSILIPFRIYTVEGSQAYNYFKEYKLVEFFSNDHAYGMLGPTLTGKSIALKGSFQLYLDALHQSEEENKKQKILSITLSEKQIKDIDDAQKRSKRSEIISWISVGVAVAAIIVSLLTKQK